MTKLYLQATLIDDNCAKFLAIKKWLGIRNNADVVRYLIAQYDAVEAPEVSQV